MKKFLMIIIGIVLVIVNYIIMNEIRVMVGINRCMIEVSNFMQGEKAYEICSK